jgi:hypothetical protein
VGLAEAVVQVVLVGRCTTPPILPPCRGWGDWNRRDVATWTLLRPKAIFAVRLLVFLSVCKATCGWSLSLKVRLARGQATLRCVAYHIITFSAPLLLLRHRWGHRAKVRGGHRRHANSYVSNEVKYVNISFRGAAPGAAPSRQKRGPCRPPRMGRQGRLPNWKASLRRGFPWYLTTCTNFNDTVTQFQSVSAGFRKTQRQTGVWKL